MRYQNETVDLVRRQSAKYLQHKGKSLLIRSPGRINLIGEHTDYNEGLVLPSAIDRAIYLELALRDDSEVNIFSVDLQQRYSFRLDQLSKSDMRWSNYLIGVVDQFLKRGYKLSGFDCIFSGDIPMGAGMSSSAAIEAGLAFGLSELNGWNLRRTDLARIAQRAENEFVGVNCGIMDQLANLLSEGGSALRVDCRTLDVEYIPFNSNDLSFVLCDTGTKHELATSEYNIRRRQCEAGVSLMRRHSPEVRSLRDVSLALLSNFSDEMDPVVYKRCKYVIEENRRVDTACGFLREGDYEDFGKLMYESHRGLRDQYEVSCKELDILVEAASASEGVLGARMMGGGFGGCTLNLVRSDSVESFSENVKTVYRYKAGKVPSIYECRLMAGTQTMD